MSHASALPSLCKPEQSSGRRVPSVLALSIFEVAERFSYLGMLTVLLYYIYYSATEGGLGFSRQDATAVVGAYGGLIYLSTVIGAWCADRVLGAERTLLSGAVLVTGGHVVLTLAPGVAGLSVGLLMVAIGSGCVKATTGTIIGMLYDEHDPRRLLAFTTYYLSICIGSLIGGVATAFAQKSLGFHIGFLTGAIGMSIGMLIFVRARRDVPEPARRVAAPLGRRRLIFGMLLTLAGTGALALALRSGTLDIGRCAQVVAMVSALLAFGYFVAMLRSNQVQAEEKHNVCRYLPLFLITIFYATGWLQLYTAVAVHSDMTMDASVASYRLPPATVLAVGPVFTLLFSPFVACLWRKLGRRQPGVAFKYAFAFVLVGSAYAALAGFSASTPKLSVLFLLFVVAAFYLADLIGAPAAISFVTAKAPRAFRSQMVSVHYLSFSIGAALSGVLAQAYQPASAAMYFGITAAACFGLAGLLCVAAHFIQTEPHSLPERSDDS